MTREIVVLPVPFVPKMKLIGFSEASFSPSLE